MNIFDVNNFSAIALQLVERLHCVDSFQWADEIAPCTIDLELARQNWHPSNRVEEEPALLILQASRQSQQPKLPTPMMEKLSKLVHQQLGGDVSRLSVMFFREPNKSKCEETLLSMTNRGMHLDFHPEICRQKAIHTLQHWIDSVGTSD